MFLESVLEARSFVVSQTDFVTELDSATEALSVILPQYQEITSVDINNLRNAAETQNEEILKKQNRNRNGGYVKSLQHRDEELEERIARGLQRISFRNHAPNPMSRDMRTLSFLPLSNPFVGIGEENFARRILSVVEKIGRSIVRGLWRFSDRKPAPHLMSHNIRFLSIFFSTQKINSISFKNLIERGVNYGAAVS